MKNVLVINGHAPYPLAEGRLNQTLFESIVETLAPHFELKTTVITKGYLDEDEVEKFKWADVIIFQFPVYWYSMPGKLKKYVEKVYQPGIFYTHSDEYGGGGLFTDKKYMYSMTCGSPREAFCAGEDSFLENKSLDEVFFEMHKLQEYCGMRALKTHCVYKAYDSLDIDKSLESLKNHLKQVFELS